MGNTRDDVAANADRVLLVEDEEALARGVRDALQYSGYAAEIATDGKAALERIRAGGLDLVLLDLMLPEFSGLEVLERIRAEGIRVPVIILTAMGAENDRVRGLELGADDYVAKPFAIRELMARVGAQIRRSRYGRDEELGPARLTCDDVEVDLARLEVHKDGLDVPLTAREGAILRHLWTRRDRVVSREELLLEVWEYATADVETRTVDATMAFLRKKIERDTSQPRFVLTVRGVGYKLGEVKSC